MENMVLFIHLCIRTIWQSFLNYKHRFPVPDPSRYIIWEWLAGFRNHHQRNTSPSTSLVLDNYWSVYAVSLYFFPHTQTSQLYGSKRLHWLSSVRLKAEVAWSQAAFFLLFAITGEVSLNTPGWRRWDRVMQWDPYQMKKGTQVIDSALAGSCTEQHGTSLGGWHRALARRGYRYRCWQALSQTLGLQPWQRLVPWESNREEYCVVSSRFSQAKLMRHKYVWIYSRDLANVLMVVQ